jgi:hypothetical protein
MQIETVKVVSPVTPENPLGYIVINAEDFHEDHVLFDPAPQADDKKAAAGDKKA